MPTPFASLQRNQMSSVPLRHIGPLPSKRFSATINRVGRPYWGTSLLLQVEFKTMKNCMLTRVLIATAAILALGQAADAGEKPGVFRRVSCTLVRFYVAKYSEGAAEAWARSRGAADAEIESARKCLGSSTTQTASFVK